jgi:adenylate cyclase
VFGIRCGLPPMIESASFAQHVLAAVRLEPDAGRLWRRTCAEVRATGVPLARASAHLRILHPLFQGLSYTWSMAEDLVAEQAHRHEEQPRVDFDGSVVGALASGAIDEPEVRVKLVNPEAGPAIAAYPSLRDLAAAGIVDHLAIRFAYTTGRINAISFSAMSPGFSDQDLALLRTLQAPLAALLELHAFKGLARRLLDAYVGPDTGARVLQGAIRRGQGRSVRAAIWFCDIRDFTRLSSELPADLVLGLLNDFFDAMAAAVRSEGGEILKFIGDAMLAVFVADATTADHDAVRCALGGATRATELMGVVNQRRAALGLPVIGYGIALHFGEVVYGNIGAEDRLDFTVIGPAVNVASRLSGLCRSLRENVLVSEAVHALDDLALRPLGRHALRGIGELEVFGLR